MTQSDMCTSVGCTISQLGWADYIGACDRHDFASVRAWGKRVRRKNGGKIPSRIYYPV
jgi:hypothetical protein